MLKIYSRQNNLSINLFSNSQKSSFPFNNLFLVPSGVIPNKIASLSCPKLDINFFAPIGAFLLTGIPPSQLKCLIPNLNMESFAKKLTFMSSAKTKGKALIKSS